MNSFSIGPFQIEPSGKPFLIAELSGNHNHSLEKALRLIDLAVEAGAHAIKIQTYTADSITIDADQPEFMIKDPKSLWDGKKLYALYQEASTPYGWHAEIFAYCKKKGVICFSTPFDEHAVDFLEQFDPPCYKIASFENNHYPLIKKVILTKKPIIISLGLTNEAEVRDLHEFLKNNGAKDFVFLKCTSTYPADPVDSNLLTIPYLAKTLNVNVGLSDHTLGTAVAVTSVALGAQVIEKHFTDDRGLGGVDSGFSLEPKEFKELVDSTLLAWKALGKVNFTLSEGEKKSLQFKRSIYVVKDMEAGEAFSTENIRVIRPGLGLSPKHFEATLGKTATQKLKRGHALTVRDVNA